MNNFNEKTIFAIELAKKSGEFMLNKKNSYLHIESKAGNDNFVTSADKEIEEFIVSSIKKAFPEDSILAEEGNNKISGKRKWIIDPIDGTTNYCFGFPCFCVSIAVMDDTAPITGVVFAPYLNELFVAEKGKGAYLNNEKISTGKGSNPSDSLIVMGFSNRNAHLRDQYLQLYNKIMPQVVDIRRTGSAAIDMCYTACGRFGLYYEPLVNIWDVAAGYLILTEAGGKVSLPNGTPIDCSKQSFGMIASNGPLYDWFLKQVD